MENDRLNECLFYTNDCCRDDDQDGKGIKFQLSASSTSQVDIADSVPIYKLADTTELKFEVGSKAGSS